MGLLPERAYKGSRSRPNHCQEHLERGDGPHHVRLICRHEDHIADAQTERLTCNPYLRPSFQHMNQRIERRSVLTQFLTFVKSKEGYVSLVAANQNAAHDGSSLVIRKLRHTGHFGAGDFPFRTWPR